MRNLIRLYREPDAAAAAAAVEPPAQTPGATPANFTPASAAASVDLNTPPAAAAAEPAAFVIPDLYKDKPYLKGVDSQEKLFKMLDGAQVLIGSKGPTVPKADAPQAEKDAYYKAIGRPETAAEYAPVLAGADKTDPKVLPKLQAAFHKAGLTPDQAKIVWDDTTSAFNEMIKEKGIADAQQDVDFEKLATDSFGVEKDRILARGKELVDANISPAMKAAAQKLDNNAYVVLADILRNIDKKYIKNDGPPGGLPAATGLTPDAIRAQAKDLMAKQLKVNSMSQEYVSLQKQIDALYDQLRAPARR